MRNKIVLAVGAHQDDIDYGASGTIAKWIEEGADAYYLICTDGSRGSADPKMNYKKLTETRKAEQKNSGKVLGLSDVIFLDYVDTELTVNHDLKRDIAKVIRTVKPNIIVTMDPECYYSTKFNFINHTDHRAAAIATMDACFPLSRDRLTFPEHEASGIYPHATEEIWFIGFDKGDVFVDITKTFDKKIEALSKHVSQFPNFSEMKKNVEDRAKYYGKKSGFKYAENFTRIVIS